MPWKLVKVNSAGEIITGQELKEILVAHNFKVPEMPPVITITAPRPRREDYDSPWAFILACAEWSEKYAKPQQIRMELRESICNQFARDLQSMFHIARFRRTSVALVIPGEDGSPKHKVFAIRLLNMYKQWVAIDPIDWICFESVK